MAKKKTKTPTSENPTSTNPTPEQLKQLASILIDTSKNAYTEAETIGFTLDDAGWEAMEKQEKLFRCEECNNWLPDESRSYPGSHFCDDCEPVDDDDVDFEDEDWDEEDDDLD